MADWWEASSRNLNSSGTPPSASISTTLNAIASFGWPALDHNNPDFDSRLYRGGTVRPHFSTGNSHQASSSDSTLTSRSITATGLQADNNVFIVQNQHVINGPGTGQFHFANTGPIWNASAVDGAGSSLFSISQDQNPNSLFDEKPMILTDLGGKLKRKDSPGTSSKRKKNETPSSLPASKVKKEKMGDRITALQQLVSPFGKTDTASVLSETIEYIKFLHDQINVLTTPYIRNGTQMEHHQNYDKCRSSEEPYHDLRSRGLCLVPISSTFPVAHETTVDFWTPTFGGSYR